MFVPFLTKRDSKRLAPRRGGGRGGGGGSSSGGGGGGSTGAGAGRSSPISAPGAGSRSATSYGSGGGKPVTIPSGQAFAGRSEGGGTRSQIYGTQTFGSGYPGVAGRGVAGLGFPFYFWPLSFGAFGGVGTAAYLHSNSEYGHSNNASRPGGVMTTVAFQSSGPNGTTFRILADTTTTTELISDIVANCSSSLTDASKSATAAPYNDTSNAPPQPEQVVQYYRASSIALSLDGYNNTAVFASEGTPDVPLPSGIDASTLDCLNQTIGLAAPLVDGVGSHLAMIPNNLGLFCLAWLVYMSSTLT